MRKAIRKALEGVRKNQTPFGACIVKNARVIACAHNRVWKSTDITAHAEITAIREACRKLKTIDLSDCVLYSTCEPCPMCFSACHWAKIKTVIYGCTIQDAARSGFHELFVSNRLLKRMGKSKLRIRGPLMRKEASEVMTIWKKKANRRTY